LLALNKVSPFGTSYRIGAEAARKSYQENVDPRTGAHVFEREPDYSKECSAFAGNDLKLCQTKQNSLNGTWNLVNETNSGMSNMSMDDMNIMTGTSGTITFGEGGSTRFVQNYDGIHQGNYWVNWLTQTNLP
jgi:hypothetical protein